MIETTPSPLNRASCDPLAFILHQSFLLRA